MKCKCNCGQITTVCRGKSRKYLSGHNTKSGKYHFAWKGAKASYVSLHTWVTRKLGTPNVCSFCKTENAKKYEWANISHLYKRDLTDWIRLCTSCHQKMDGSRYKQWETMRGAIL